MIQNAKNLQGKTVGRAMPLLIFGLLAATAGNAAAYEHDYDNRSVRSGYINPSSNQHGCSNQGATKCRTKYVKQTISYRAKVWKQAPCGKSYFTWETRYKIIRVPYRVRAH